jgi:hypothetical protein
MEAPLHSVINWPFVLFEFICKNPLNLQLRYFEYFAVTDNNADYYRDFIPHFHVVETDFK